MTTNPKSNNSPADRSGSRIAILGTGMSAFGAASRLRNEPVSSVLYDKNPFFGGHTLSLKNDQGFIFDIGPHVSFTSDTRIQDIFASSIDGEYETHDYQFSNYWEGHWVIKNQVAIQRYTIFSVVTFLKIIFIVIVVNSGY